MLAERLFIDRITANFRYWTDWSANSGWNSGMSCLPSKGRSRPSCPRSGSVWSKFGISHTLIISRRWNVTASVMQIYWDIDARELGLTWYEGNCTCILLIWLPCTPPSIPLGSATVTLNQKENQTKRSDFQKVLPSFLIHCYSTFDLYAEYSSNQVICCRSEVGSAVNYTDYWYYLLIAISDSCRH